MCAIRKKEARLNLQERNLQIKETRLKVIEDNLSKCQKEFDDEIIKRKKILNDEIIERYQKLEDEIRRRLSDVDEIMNSHSQSFSYLARLFSDYNYIMENKTANLLAHKKPHTALKASEELKRIAKEKKSN